MGKQRKKYFLYCILVTFIIFVTIAGVFIVKRTEPRSLLHRIMNQMAAEGLSWKTPSDIPFELESQEALFLSGLQDFGMGNYNRARRKLEQVNLEKGNDPALAGYTNFFLNETIYILSGSGDPKLVEEVFEEMFKYEPFKEELLWTSAVTLSYNQEYRQNAVDLLEDFLRINTDLSIEYWASIKNIVGMIEYMQENYAKSVRDFYDVMLRLENRVQNTELRNEYIYALEYIANIYYEFEDYNGAIEQYTALIDGAKERGEPGTYSHYLNLSTAYLELGETEKAKTVIKELEFLLPEQNPMLQSEIRGSINEVLASIAMEEDDYDLAGTYLEEALYEYERNPGVYYGGWYQVDVTYCKYLLYQKNYEEVIRRMEALLESGIGKEYGMEHDMYDTLLQAYEGIGNIEKQMEIYQKHLYREQEKEKNIKHEYLEFSTYYRDANRLQNQSVERNKSNGTVFLAICAATFCSLTFYYVIKYIRERGMVDQLMGVYNYKRLERLKRKYTNSNKDVSRGYGVIAADIDCFKEYNEMYGKEMGNEVLKQVARVLTTCIRGSDEVIRYGGEAFIIILNEADKEEAADICERIKKRLKELHIPHNSSTVKSYITVSMGIGIRKSHSSAEIKQMVSFANELLLDAKRAGRDCYRIKEIPSALQ